MSRSHQGLLLSFSVTLAACTPLNTAANGQSPTGLPPVNYAPLPPVPAVNRARVVGVHLKTQPGGATLADLDRDTDPFDDYKPAVNVQFSADDEPVSKTGTLKVRGHSTRLTQQKSYTVNLAKEGTPWQGTRTINLNKHPYDLTRFRNKLSFDLFAGIKEIPALKAEFRTLDIDAADYGLFTQIEEPNKDFLKRVNLDEKGQFYKAQNFAFERTPELKLQTEAGYDTKAFEKVLSIQGNKDHAKLLGMLDALGNAKEPINNIIARNFDRANYITWLACQVLLENLDTNSQNFYLYSPTTSNVWTFMPWDYDGAWGFYEQPNEIAQNGKPARWTEGLGNWWGVTLHRRFLKEPENLAQVAARVDQLADNYFTPERIQAYINSYKNAVRPLVLKAPDLTELPLLSGEAAPQFDAEVQRLSTEVQNRRALFHEALERPMPIFLGEVEQVDGGRRFPWDEATDLQGDPITYDFEISRTPAFASEDVVISKTGLKEAGLTLTERLSPGTYFWRVISRDTKAPSTNWQIPFNQYDSPDNKHYHGVKQLVI